MVSLLVDELECGKVPEDLVGGAVLSDSVFVLNDFTISLADLLLDRLPSGFEVSDLRLDIDSLLSS